jgi:hypothetical protein
VEASLPAFFFLAVLSVCCRVFTYNRAAKGVTGVEGGSGELVIGEGRGSYGLEGVGDDLGDDTGAGAGQAAHHRTRHAPT